MYQIYAKNRSVEKDFDKLISSLSPQQQTTMMTVLATSPKATQAGGEVLNKWRSAAVSGNTLQQVGIELFMM